MTGRILRAIFGDVRGAHSLISATPDSPKDVLNELAFRYTDRLLPAEVPWGPYTCGYPLSSYYVVTRTFPVRASRAGMVQTHAALVPSTDAGLASSIESLTQLLPFAAVSDPAAYPLPALNELIPGEFSSDLRAMPLGGAAVVRYLLDGNTPVWLGQDGFDPLISFIWKQMWPDARRVFRYRVSSDPNSLADMPADVVCTPVGLRMNWNTRALFDSASQVTGKPSQAEAFLLGLPDGSELSETLERLSLPGLSLSVLRRVERYAALLRSATADGIRAATRLLGSIAPAATDALADKATLVSELARRTADGTEDDVLGLRNLELAPFDRFRAEVGDAIARWMGLCITNSVGGVRVAKETFITVNPWSSYARAALVRAFLQWSPSAASLIWDWWRTEPDLVLCAESILPATDIPENDLLRTLPHELPDGTFRDVLTLSISRRWFRLHAAVLSKTTVDIGDKIHRQIEVETSDPAPGLDLLLEPLSASDILSAWLTLSEPRLLPYVLKAVTSEPTLMNAIELSRSSWRHLWCAVIESGSEPFDGITDRVRIAYQLMDLALSGVGVPTELIGRVASRQEACLLHYPRRSEVLSLLSPDLRSKALKTVACEYLRALGSPREVAAVEPDVVPSILLEWHADRALVSPDGLPQLFQYLGGELNEDECLTWLASSSTRWSSTAALAIGRMILGHRWSRSALKILGLNQSGRSDVTMALKECVSVLGFFDQMRFAIFSNAVQVNVDEWWRQWFELSIHLYSRGLEENNIWSEGGGDLADKRGETAREEWRSALDNLRKGAGSRYMTISGLLHQMRRDFANNGDLALLEEVYLRYLAGERKR